MSFILSYLKIKFALILLYPRLCKLVSPHPKKIIPINRSINSAHLPGGGGGGKVKCFCLFFNTPPNITLFKLVWLN